MIEIILTVCMRAWIMLVDLRRSPVVTMYNDLLFSPVTPGTSYAYANYSVLSCVADGVLIDSKIL